MLVKLKQHKLFPHSTFPDVAPLQAIIASLPMKLVHMDFCPLNLQREALRMY